MEPKVFTVLSGKTGCEWVRILHPYRYLARHGMDVKILPEREIRNLPLMGLPDYNIYVLSRRTPKANGLDHMLQMIQIEKLRGTKVIYEIDDDPFSTRFHHDPEEIKTVLRACDGAIVSTKRLGERIQPHTQPYVFRNYLDGELWEKYPRISCPGKIRIGITGSPTHYEDWILASDALHEIGEKYDQVEFIAFGYVPDYLEDLPRLEIVDAVSYKLYPSILKRFDIGLAPLSGADEFNLYKSPIKALDYMAAGSAALVSDHPVYQQVNGCHFVKDDEWFQILDHYISNPSELRRLQARGLKWTQRNRLLSTGWKELAQCFRRILKE